MSDIEPVKNSQRLQKITAWFVFWFSIAQIALVFVMQRLGGLTQNERNIVLFILLPVLAIQMGGIWNVLVREIESTGMNSNTLRAIRLLIIQHILFAAVIVIKSFWADVISAVQMYWILTSLLSVMGIGLTKEVYRNIYVTN